MAGTPAYDAGHHGRRPHREGRRQVDRRTWSASDATKLIQGEPGTKVTLTIRREGRSRESPSPSPAGGSPVHPVLGCARRADDPTEWDWFLDPQEQDRLRPRAARSTN